MIYYQRSTLNENTTSNTIKYHNTSLEIDMTDNEYDKYNKYFSEIFNAIDKEYKNVLTKCYDEQFKDYMKDLSFQDFLKTFKLDKNGRMGCFDKHSVIFIELNYLLKTYKREIPMCITFFYNIDKKKIRFEFDGSD